MLVGQNDLLRVAAPLFWVEWNDTSHGTRLGRVGLLVNADEDGRSGQIETFWEQSDGEPVYAQATIEFDLNQEIYHRATQTAFAVDLSTHSLAPHLLFCIDDNWLQHFFSRGSETGIRTIGTIVNSLFAGIEMLFCFSILLAERAELKAQPIDLSRINSARIKNGRPPLLDHVEARMD